MPLQPAIYILANPYRTLYIGVTGDLETRLFHHRQEGQEGFAQRYELKALVYFENFFDMSSAIARETQLKKWNRGKKLRLIERLNPQWVDLSRDWGKLSLPISPNGE